MIKIKTTNFFWDKETSESETTAEEACRLLHSLSYAERMGKMIICESNEDKTQLINTYYDMYHDEFNIRHQINEKEQMHLQLAYPAQTDVFYVENLFFRFEAGIRKLDPRRARVNTHQTCFIFDTTPIYECIAVDNEPDEKTKTKMNNLKQYIICKHEQLNHLSYKDAQEYIEQVWTAYQSLFREGLEPPSIDKIVAVNKQYDVPWYNRL